MIQYIIYIITILSNFCQEIVPWLFFCPEGQVCWHHTNPEKEWGKKKFHTAPLTKVLDVTKMQAVQVSLEVYWSHQVSESRVSTTHVFFWRAFFWCMSQNVPSCRSLGKWKILAKMKDFSLFGKAGCIYFFSQIVTSLSKFLPLPPLSLFFCKRREVERVRESWKKGFF